MDWVGSLASLVGESAGWRLTRQRGSARMPLDSLVRRSAPHVSWGATQSSNTSIDALWCDPSLLPGQSHELA